LHHLLGKAIPFNRLGRLGECCKLPIGVWGKAPAEIDLMYSEREKLILQQIIWIFVYRNIHTYVLYKIHIDNIAVVLPLVT